jgi:plasmid stabilization system protein ParE
MLERDMTSGYKVIWSQRASRDLNGIQDYLESKWTEKEIRGFFRNLEKHLELIRENPKLYPAADKWKEVRRCVLSKQTSLYYRIKSRTIEIITLFDNRQNPDKLKK